MLILVGLILFGLGVYLYRKVIVPDKVAFTNSITNTNSREIFLSTAY